MVLNQLSVYIATGSKIDNINKILYGFYLYSFLLCILNILLIKKGLYTRKTKKNLL